MLQIAAPYDWRLAIASMEYRDGYFADLKVRIELLHTTHGEKVCRLLRLLRCLMFPVCTCNMLVLQCRVKQATALFLKCQEGAESQAILLYSRRILLGFRPGFMASASTSSMGLCGRVAGATHAINNPHFAEA